MKAFLKYSARLAVTGVMVASAVVVWWRLWVYYMDALWTGDGRLRADVVNIAPDVSGLVSEVLVRDNDNVQKGQVLFRVDSVRFELALRHAEARVECSRAALDQATRESNPSHALTDLAVTQEKKEQRTTALQQAAAAYQQAIVDRDTAKLNVARSSVTASVPGQITNFDLLPGNYATAGHPVTALVATQTLRVEGYFEETKLDQIHVGDPASVKLLGARDILHGHVESVAGGIKDRERDESTQLIPGRTATVRIDRDDASADADAVARLLKAFD